VSVALLSTRIDRDYVAAAIEKAKECVRLELPFCLFSLLPRFLFTALCLFSPSSLFL
jgi:hypothetical protein